MIPTFEAQREAWSSPPVDGVGYISSAEMLRWSDDKLRRTISNMQQTRYGGWRNYRGLWRDVLGLDTTWGKRVLDYGCGVGLEALQYAKAGNRVCVADIVFDNVALAKRVIGIHGYDATGIVFDTGVFLRCPFDVIHCAGVLHHIPHPTSVVRRMSEWLCSDGELRLIMYSDQGWRVATDTEPPDDVTFHPAREHFVRFFDAVGGWADWYNQARLESRFGQWFDVVRCEYITPDDRYLAAVLRRKD